MMDTMEQEKDLQQLQDELTYKEKLLRITNSIHAAKNLDEIFLNLQGQILELFDAEKLTLYAVDKAQNQLFSKYKVGNETGEIRVMIDKKSISGFAAHAKTNIIIEDAYNTEELKQIDPELGFNQSFDVQSGFRTKQVLASPILFQDETLGVVQLINKKSGGKYNQQEILSLNEIADTLGIAFYNHTTRQRKAPTKFSYLVQNSLITEQELNNIIIKSRQTGNGVISILRNEFNISKKNILDSLANFYNCPFADFDPKFYIDKRLLNGLCPEFFMKDLWSPFRINNGMIEVLVDDPHNIQKVNAVRYFYNSTYIRFIGALPEDIIRYLQGISRRERKRAFKIDNLES